jgi:predicted signal transduction protein with EAL and GGDEF domain
MDDFGTGYSGLSYLTRFPVKKIKIDRSFIDTLDTSPQTSAIVSSIVGLGQSLNVTITAEGVETEGQAAMLRKWGCDQVLRQARRGRTGIRGSDRRPSEGRLAWRKSPRAPAQTRTNPCLSLG